MSGVKGMKWGVRNGPPYPLESKFKNPNELLSHMSSFKYSEFTRLKSPDEVEKSKSGSCHDQVMYELRELRKMSLDPKAMFIMEVNKNTGQGGMTHSLVYFNDNNRTYYLENAWEGNRGLHVMKTDLDIKNRIKKAHNNGSFGAKSQFNTLLFSDFHEERHKIGEDLQELVDRCLD